MTTRKSFSNKKELIKYLLDADSNAEEYILDIPLAVINSQKILISSEQSQSKQIKTIQPVHLKFIIDKKRPNWEIFKQEKKILSLKSSSFHSLYCFGQIITEKLCSFKIKKISGHFFFGIGTDNEQQKAYGYGPKYRILISSFGGISANNTHKITMIKNQTEMKDGATVEMIVNLMDWIVSFKVDETIIGSCEICQPLKNMPVYPVIGMDQCGDDQDLGRDVIQLF